LEQLYATFHRERLKLPKVVFRRAREKVSIDVASSLIDGDDMGFPRRISLSFVKGLFSEILTALEFLRSRFKTTDAFDLEKFLDYCRGLQSNLPNTDEELALLIAQLDDRQKARHSAMSPWERLGGIFTRMRGASWTIHFIGKRQTTSHHTETTLAQICFPTTALGHQHTQPATR
jgi:hypothetical protein